MKQKYVFYLFLVFFSYTSQAQLSDLHYLPPLKQYSNNNAIQKQSVYLSTPETTAFNVTVYRGNSATPLTTLTGLSNTNSIKYDLADGDNNITLVTDANTGVVLSNAGLRFESAGGQSFYVNYRGRQSAQAASLTSKGRSAMGTKFKWGGMPLRSTNTASQSATLGIMATEDNTTVTISGYDPACEFRLGGDPDGITNDSITISLNSGQSYVLQAILAQAAVNLDGWIGASVESDKDIVISNGGLLCMVLAGSASRDAGIDQPVPEEIVGRDYVFVRGNGVDGMEKPIIIATQDNTEVFVNGSATPITTLNNGDYFDIPSSNYSGTSAGANMLVTTSKSAYAYQALAGSSSQATGGLNFVAPVNCLMPKILDNIPNIRNVAGLNFTGGVTIIASTSTPDANITVTDGTGSVTLPASTPVAGTSDWKTFFIAGLTGDVSVQSTGPISVGFLGANSSAGIAGYFSGFDTAPVVDLQVTGGGCLPGGTVQETSGAFDAYQWFMDGVAIAGATSATYTPPPTVVFAELFVRVTQGSCTFDSDPISVYSCDPDIVLTKTANATTFNEGDTVTFTITAESLGIDPVTNLVVTDNLPDGLTLISATPSFGSWSAPNWTIGTINSGEKHTLTIQATIDSPGLSNTIINSVSNTQDQIDSNMTTDDPFEIIFIDNDGDGITGVADLDSDNDGILDVDECGGKVEYGEIQSFRLSNVSNTSNGEVLIGSTATQGPFDTTNGGQFDVQMSGTGGYLLLDGVHQMTNSGSQTIRFFDSGTSNPVSLQGFVFTFSDWEGSETITGLTLTLEDGSTLQYNNTNGWSGFKDKDGFGLGDAETDFIVSGTGLRTNYPNGGGGQNNKFGKLDVSQFRIKEIELTGSGTFTFGWEDNGFIVDFSFTCDDTDGDGIPNYLDLDSDNDGCYDALEASENVTSSQLDANGRINITAQGGIDSDGVPNLVNSSGAADVGNDQGQETTGNETEATKIQIDTQPENSSICLDNNATFTIIASSLSTTSYTGTAPSTTPDYSGSTSTTSGLVYLWQEQVSGSGSWNDLTDTGIYSNTTTATLTLTSPPLSSSTNKYRCIITSTKNSCSSLTSSEASLEVKPKPTLDATDLTNTSCSDVALSRDLTLDVTETGTTFTWIAADNANVTGESTSLQTTTTINDVLTNTSGTDQTVTYTVTPSGSNGCTADAYTVTVTVQPEPTLDATDLTNTSCSDVALSRDLTLDVTETGTT
ncbi:PKD-like domain-containing protein, partial [Aquimarina hainanensis]